MIFNISLLSKLILNIVDDSGIVITARKKKTKAEYESVPTVTCYLRSRSKLAKLVDGHSLTEHFDGGHVSYSHRESVEELTED